MNKKGYTMIELLFVVTTILILITIATPTYKHAADTAKIVATRAELNNIRDALHAYYLVRGTYPAALDDSTFLRVPEDTDGGYIFHDPANGIDVTKDQWNQEYRYRPGTRNQDGYVKSDGPDGQPNTADDMTAWLVIHR